MSHNFLIRSSVDDCLDCFHMLGPHVLNSATMNMNVHVLEYLLPIHAHIGVEFEYIVCIKYSLPPRCHWGSALGDGTPPLSGSRLVHATCLGQ